MQTALSDKYKDSPEGQEAEAILRKCVHCGFCTATCPTYQILGDELDSPRGRIYLIKQVLEGAVPTAKTQLHLDRCLTCRSCETTCPSGVEYGHLVDIGRKIVDAEVPRSLGDEARRKALGYGLTNPLFGLGMKLGQAFRWAVPDSLKAKVPEKQLAGLRPAARHARKMLLLEGCVQPSMMPNINNAAARVLDQLGISLLTAGNAGCCGAVKFHLNYQADGLDDMRRNIDAWWPYLDQGVEAILMTASGCGVTVREYGHHLKHDPRYAEKAARISALTRDIAEVLVAEEAQFMGVLEAISAKRPVHGGLQGQSGAVRKRVAFHPPCTLQHGQQLRGLAERMLTKAGFDLVPVAESHLCCGSAGTYSVLQPELANQLKARKLSNLEAQAPDMICSSNIGCVTHLQSGTQRPVRHWIEVVDSLLTP
jgi:glycolate oxidase iron-sulfur subunit